MVLMDGSKPWCPQRSLGRMALVMCVGVLLAGLEKGESFPGETPNNTIVRAENRRHVYQCVEQKRPRACKVCQIIVTGLMKYVEGRFIRRSVALCMKLKPELRVKCLQTAVEYKGVIMRKLFDGSAKATCLKYKACKKKSDDKKQLLDISAVNN